MIRAKEGVLMEKRIKTGLSKSDLARNAEMNHSVICRVENGGSISPKSAKAICEALGEEFETLFEIEPRKGNENVTA